MPPPDAGARHTVLGSALRVRSIGEGAPTVLLHGGGPGCSAWTDFAALVPELPGRRLVLIDLPQYGGSAAPRADGPLFSFHARHVTALLDGMGVGRADFVCQSLGGSVALLIAAREPSRVRRIVLTGARPADLGGAPGVSGAEIRAEYYGGDGPSPEKMRDLIRSYEWHDPASVPEATVHKRFRNSVTPDALALGRDTEARGLPEDLGALLPDVLAPVLLLWGSADPFAGIGYASRLAAALPRSLLEVLPHTAHHPQEERPRDYARLTEAFLLDSQLVPLEATRCES
ncbi:alpha/beta fold hydrolase [Actinomadura sp. KC345]|uniref:alpha/beta fold hydrolase n=1 Tax=Actinomadura sp. KC345 TaxID=2530371 RepID=UPI001043C0D8|nr:alpha/beta hydrolase [Actinomadura sp. KC345]TDC47341.1 alpha/beta fold hydrolase [Actinomadura sp. KC345]